MKLLLRLLNKGKKSLGYSMLEAELTAARATNVTNQLGEGLLEYVFLVQECTQVQVLLLRVSLAHGGNQPLYVVDSYCQLMKWWRSCICEGLHHQIVQ
jgi:hypothetical protein